MPSQTDRDIIGRIIFDELVNGVVKDSSRKEMQALVARYDVDGVILGCTELCMILEDGDCDVPVFSTTHIHADAINDWIGDGLA